MIAAQAVDCVVLIGHTANHIQTRNRKDGLIPAANAMNWDAAEVHEIEFRFRKCLSTNCEPAVLPVQLGRPNEILKRDHHFVSDRNRQVRNNKPIDFEEMFRTSFRLTSGRRTTTPNPPGTIPISESSKRLA